MNTQLIAQVTADKKLEMPAGVLQQLQPFTEYEVTVTENEINLQKKTSPITLAEIRRRVKAAGHDPQQPSLEEISQIVKEVRQELWG